ncbi:MAG TPA: HXXEE domain-containing protein [Devosia sp.]|uniref:HXXEE domain-containing protein n=1 Tax=Devosia sp. TaxID=1871048 RepID=UPI002F953BB0
MLRRLIANWVYGGFLAALLLLVLTPVLAQGWPLALTLVFLVIPTYMLHQYEEHDDDRFHRAVNQLMGQGRDVLPSRAIFLINVPLVWSVNAWVFAAARSDLGWGLIGLYTLLANALVHIVPAVATRRYNPGLITAVILFLPLGLWGSQAVLAATPVTLLQQIVAIAVAVGVHVGIVLYVQSNVRRLRGRGRAA